MTGFELEEPDTCNCGREFKFNKLENLMYCEYCGREK